MLLSEGYLTILRDIDKKRFEDAPTLDVKNQLMNEFVNGDDFIKIYCEEIEIKEDVNEFADTCKVIIPAKRLIYSPDTKSVEVVSRNRKVEIKQGDLVIVNMRYKGNEYEKEKIRRCFTIDNIKISDDSNEITLLDTRFYLMKNLSSMKLSTITISYIGLIKLLFYNDVLQKKSDPIEIKQIQFNNYITSLINDSDLETVYTPFNEVIAWDSKIENFSTKEYVKPLDLLKYLKDTFKDLLYIYVKEDGNLWIGWKYWNDSTVENGKFLKSDTPRQYINDKILFSKDKFKGDSVSRKFPFSYPFKDTHFFMFKSNFNFDSKQENVLIKILSVKKDNKVEKQISYQYPENLKDEEASTIKNINFGFEVGLDELKKLARMAYTKEFNPGFFGDFETIGLPKITKGDIIEFQVEQSVNNLDDSKWNNKSITGLYYVESVNHTFSGGKIRQTVRVNKIIQDL